MLNLAPNEKIERTYGQTKSLTDTQQSRLTCTYNSTVSAYAKLAPFKMEQLSLEPYIAPYHGFATRREMDLLKALAKAELTPAKIYDGKKLYIDKERTATLSWLTHKHDLVLQLFKRLELITGICQYGGPLQVSNYGIGGYFHEHLDFFDEM
ncbi:prolyl 4-hydroxylase subunit alpha-3 [Drosophila busckii]|uniref:prolyl 4-hydroxylase subunit alpha-3 n=1 Tax=Drosophila busckii TaxID=30019 RepID=UPI00083F3970|nr:prolyl 4-hydroxylase subunit alpha-3 [Drosophila busckii]